jgi:hypothetical protein
MQFAQRDAAGNIIGLFSVKQNGYAEEEVGDDAVLTPTVLQQIAILETTITPRRMREAMLGTDNGWMLALDAQIAMLRERLT